jgi:hypothetical protein
MLINPIIQSKNPLLLVAEPYYTWQYVEPVISYVEFYFLGRNAERFRALLATWVMFVSCLAYSSTLKIEVKYSFESSLDLYPVISQKTEPFSRYTCVTTSLLSNVYGVALSPGLKQPEREANRPFPSRPEVKNNPTLIQGSKSGYVQNISEWQ